MSRTTNAQVQALLGGLYGQVSGVVNPLDPYVAMASNVVDQAVSLAATSIGPGIGGTIGRTVPNGTQAELMERALAAHYYTQMDPQFDSKGQGGASASFNRVKPSTFGDQWQPFEKMAVDADPSGCLAAILKRKVAGGAWLGKPVSSQIPIWQRS